MNEDQISKVMLDALGVLMIASYTMLRTIEGDEFVLGWLESARVDIAENPPSCEFRMQH